MATIHAVPVATTTAGSPRASASVDYDGTSDKTVKVLLVCPTWASADPAQVVTIRVQQSFDAGQSWDDFAILTTTGGRVSRTGLMPQMTCQCIDLRGVRKARVVLDVDRDTLDAGVDLTA